MSSLPVWARKPKHKKKVIPTDRGWVVEETGEVLYRVNGLVDKLKQLLSETVEIDQMVSSFVEPDPDLILKADDSKTVVPQPIVSSNEPEANSETTEEQIEIDYDTEEIVEPEPEVTKPKRRGRPPKNKSAV